MELCMHCLRLEKGIEIDMYQYYLLAKFMPSQERQEMWNCMYDLYPLYFQIYNWIQM